MTEPAHTPPDTGSGAFDAHHAPSSDLVNACVHCGFCLATCPTYALWGEEMDSPRGRIYLMKLGLEGQVRLDPTFVNHMDNCLGCMACLTSCPSGVQYDKLIEATRAQIERNYPRPAPDGLLRRMIFDVFPRPDRLRLLLAPLALYQRSGLQSLVRRSGLVKLLPPACASWRTSRRRFHEKQTVRSPSEWQQKANAPARGFAAGMCAERFFSRGQCRHRARTGRGRLRGGDSRDQCCCGALMIHAGEEKAALDYARRTIDAFERAQVDTVVSNAAGCGSNLKDYGYLLRDYPRVQRAGEGILGEVSRHF